ncbi:MAG: metallopeptidase family protein [Sphingomonadales bacterium]|nr:metallopeptidase family protein [Sphingomonadales bacterium]PIX66340.1 MAG: neutral zinc metallopeptidase [Sphingomonadales bacterium CG_4_10_14_3_um_filter_58_15]NCO50306.1 metallopeptidase family protein [Sphingomonadales bacterium]NCP00331.1 metallopeptidase family protein [Sphingomonadales bacterium]NCP25986.1 metallopeptidase family protein [Sphingomonadales bacterium]
MTMTNPPNITDFETIARRVFETIPAPFAEHLTDIVLRIEDWPAQEILDHFGMTSGYQLSGLYQGVPVGEKTQWAQPSGEGDHITLYRRPLLAEMAQTGVALEALIRHVVIHEVGHHFGLSDADMHAIEDSAED